VRAKSGAPLAFAGLWETRSGPNGEELDTSVIITTAANSTLAGIYHRMPAIVPPEALALWLDCTQVDPITAAALLRPAPEDLLAAHEVSPAVNRAANDDPKLIEPVAAQMPSSAASEPPRALKRMREKKASGQGTLF
jgi:putative SOS response-associated peptidase YedK